MKVDGPFVAKLSLDVDWQREICNRSGREQPICAQQILFAFPPPDVLKWQSQRKLR